MKKLLLLVTLLLILPGVFASRHLATPTAIEYASYVNGDHDNECEFTATLVGWPYNVKVILKSSGNEISIDNFVGSYRGVQHFSGNIYFEYYNLYHASRGLDLGVEISRDITNMELYHVTVRTAPYDF